MLADQPSRRYVAAARCLQQQRVHRECCGDLSKKKKRKCRIFTDEYKAEIVKLCQQPGKTPNGVAIEFGLTPSAVMGWAKQAAVDAGGGVSGALTTTEREELAALRKENRQLRQEREILKRATGFFAKEGAAFRSPCDNCGHITVRNGACHQCLNCGSSMGCS